MTEQLMSTLYTAGIFVIPVLFVLVIFAKMKKPEPPPLEDGELVGTADDLAAAEHAAKHFDMKKTLQETSALAERFAGDSSYTREYMDQLVAYLRDQGIHAEYLHTPSPYTQVGGSYDLYVLRDQVEEAQKHIDAFKAR